MSVNEPAKILLVDDSVVIRNVTKKVLEIAGHKLDLAENGLDGLARINAGNYDLILLDIKMPFMDGFEVFHKLRSQEKTKLLPEIIFYSDLEKKEIEGLQLGASDFITKSHVSEHPKEFVARVEAHLKIAELTRKSLELEGLRIFKATVMSVDHEIRNPLLSLSLILDRMKNCQHCAQWYERGKESAERISDALEKLAGISIPITTNFKGQEIIETPEDSKPDKEL